jgi:hypothetical protein
MLTGAMFMLEIYDRVLPSRSVPTLVGIAIPAAGLYAAQGILDLIRSRVLSARRRGQRARGDKRTEGFEKVIFGSIPGLVTNKKRAETDSRIKHDDYRTEARTDARDPTSQLAADGYGPHLVRDANLQQGMQSINNRVRGSKILGRCGVPRKGLDSLLYGRVSDQPPN